MKRIVVLSAVAAVACALVYAALQYYGGWDMDARPAPESPQYFITGRGVALRAFAEVPWEPGEPVVTYIGHYTLLIEMGDKRVLTDPFWADTVGYHKRIHLPYASPADTGRLDAVLVTSSAAGHFDTDSLAALDTGATLVVPEALAERAGRCGFASVEAPPPWGIVQLGDIEIVAVPTSSPRASGYIVSDGTASVYVTGPTAPFDGLERVSDYWRLDIMAAPYLGGSRGDVFTPAQAAAAVRALQPTAVIPLGYRTITRLPFFWTALPPDDWARKAGTRISRVVPMDIGDRLEIVR